MKQNAYEPQDDTNGELPSPADNPPDAEILHQELQAEETENVKLKNIAASGGVKTKKDDIVIQTLTIAGQVEGHYALSAQTKSTK